MSVDPMADGVITLVPHYALVPVEVAPLIAMGLSLLKDAYRRDAIEWGPTEKHVFSTFASVSDVVRLANAVTEEPKEVTEGQSPMTSSDLHGTIGVSEYAQAHSMDEANTRRLCRSGKLPAFKTEDNQWRIMEEAS
jgi:hypothetical protein